MIFLVRAPCDSRCGGARRARPCETATPATKKAEEEAGDQSEERAQEGEPGAGTDVGQLRGVRMREEQRQPGDR